MTAVAESLAAEASKGIFGIVKQEVDYCIHCTKYVKDFQTELETLENTLEDAEKLENISRNNNEEISKVGKNWLKDAKDLRDVADRLKKKTKEKSKCVIGWRPNCICRYVIGKKAADMTVTLKSQIAKFKPENFSLPASPPGMEFYAPTNFVDLESRKIAYDKVWKALQDKQNLRIGVHALGGLGKTTLVKELGYKAEKEKLFDKVVFVVVSNTVEFGRIQDDIADQLGLTLKSKGVSSRAAELWKRLKQEEKDADKQVEKFTDKQKEKLTNKQGERILIILDDVWNKLDLTAIGIPLRDTDKGCRLLLTTRRVDVCTSMECQAMIPLSLLSDEDSLELFQKYANISNNPTIPLGLAKEIANECKGLPVAIATMASTLKGKERRKWEVALKSLKDSKPLTDIPVHLEDFYNSFSFCYANLENKELQKLLLLCSFFLEDYRIPIEILTRYAIGLGLFKYDGSYEDTRKQVNDAIEELDSRLLLHANKDVNGEYMSMHDLVHEAAQWIANREIMVIMGSKIDEDAMDKARYLRFHKINDLPNQLNFPKLEILVILFETEHSAIYFAKQEELFRGLENLRVLILTWELVRDSIFGIKLPISIHMLKSLRVLSLKGWSLGDISVIRSLTNLEVLELFSCKIDELPSELVEFKNLRLLDLLDCEFQENPFKVMGRFKHLEELYYSSSSKEEVDGEDISNHFGENCQLKELTRYRIQIGESYGKFPQHLRCLSISRFHPFTSSATIKKLVRRAEHLYLQNIQGDSKNIVPDVVRAVGSEIQWNQLVLSSCDDVECLIDATNINVSSKDASILSALVELRVDDMNNLRELCHGTPPSGSFEKLKELFVTSCFHLCGILFVGNLNLRSLKVVRVENCPMLTSLFTLSVALSLELLEELYVDSCSGLKYIIELEKDVYDQMISSASIFQKLKSLEIWWCESLEFIFPVCSAQCPAKLESLWIVTAPKLKSVFEQCYHDYHLSYQNKNTIHMGSSALREFGCWDCPMLATKTIYVFMFHSDASEPDCITNEATLWHENMLNIEFLSLDTIGIEGIFLVKGLPTNELTSRLESLYLENLLELSYICKGPQHCLSFQNLLGLSVKRCEKLNCIFSASVLKSFPELEELTIENCSELEKIIEDGKEDKIYFPNLTTVSIKQCNKLKYLFFISQSNEFPKLNDLSIQESSQLEEVFRWRMGVTQHMDNALLPKLEKLTLIELPCLTNVCQGFNWETIERPSVKGCPKVPLEYRDKEGEESSEEEITEKDVTEEGEESSEEEITEKDVTEVECKEANQEVAEHEERKKREEVVIGKPSTSADNKKTHIADLDSVKSNTMDQKENRDAAPQTSSDLPSGTSGEAPKEFYPTAAPQTINMNEKIQNSSSNTPEFPPSTSFPSSTSGHARKESSTPEEEEGISQKCPTPANPAMVTSSAESDIRRQSPSTMLGEISAGQTEPSVALPLRNSLNPREYQNTGEGSKALSTSVTEPTAPSTSLFSSISLHPIPKTPPENRPLSSSVAQFMVTLGEEYAAFRDIGVTLKKKHIPLLEQAMVKHPSLWVWHEKHKRPRMKQYGYATLGDMLEFLTTTRWRDLTQEKKDEFESLMNDLETIGFDIQWLRKTEAMIKQSNIEEEIINRINTLKGQEMKQKIAVEFLEDSLQKAKRELENTTSEMEAIQVQFKLGDLDDLIGF